MAILQMLWKPWTSAPRASWNAAYAAALALVAIQVGIGIILKAAQTGGSYSFSPSASVTISEFLKMLLSTLFFYRECRIRSADGVSPSNRGFEEEYNILPSSETKREETISRSSPGPLPHLGLRTFWNYIRGEVTGEVRYGFCNLALFYVLINNSIFVSYKMADPGTIQLTKSGVTFITAIVMITTLGAKISRIQWTAIIMQICGLAVTQYNPTTGTTYSMSTYLILLFQVFLSASSGVYNQALLKSDDSSLHADNMVLYAAGASINLLVHVVVRIVKFDEPGFFTGYDSFGAIMVIVSNVFIGLAITAVYKYADAVVKCFATAVATGILLYVSPILFGTKLSFLVLPGTVVVFVASWLYMDNPPPKPAKGMETVSEPQKPSLFSHISAFTRKYRVATLGSATSLTVLICAYLTMLQTSMPGVDVGKTKTLTESTIVSPFNNSVAMVRWNSYHPERVPMIMKYEPFFHTMHISMPAKNAETRLNGTENFQNRTYDQWENANCVYTQVARTMELLLEESPDVEGLTFFHFDAWLNPLTWSNWNRDHIWYPEVTGREGQPEFYGPRFMCLRDPEEYSGGWWGWRRGFHRRATAAAKAVEASGLPYTVNADEFCVGWSDIYYVPRKYFPDYIVLASIFQAFNVFHEVAIPTILHIIDQSRRINPEAPVLDTFGDCWGNCCEDNPKPIDVQNYRCGHRLNYLDKDTTEVFYNHLDKTAKMLGRNFTEEQFAFEAGFESKPFGKPAPPSALDSGKTLEEMVEEVKGSTSSNPDAVSEADLEEQKKKVDAIVSLWDEREAFQGIHEATMKKIEELKAAYAKYGEQVTGVPTPAS